MTFDFSFLPLNLACKSWSSSRYKWITGQHKEVRRPAALRSALRAGVLTSALCL